MSNTFRAFSSGGNRKAGFGIVSPEYSSRKRLRRNKDLKAAVKPIRMCDVIADARKGGYR